MSTEVGKIHYALDLDDSQFRKKAQGLGGHLKELSGNFDVVGSSIKRMIAPLLTGAAVTGFVAGGMRMAGQLENLQIALETVTGSSEDAAKAMDIVKKTAKESPFFETETLARFVQLMAASGQNIDDAVKSALGFGDVAAAFGKGNEEMTRMGNTLSQVIGKGKADAVDFKELVNAGWVSVKKDTAEAMGVTMEQFEKMVSEGKVGYEQIWAASEKFTGSAEKQSGTFSSLHQRLKETVGLVAAEFVEQTGLFDLYKSGLEGLISRLETFASTENIQAVATALRDLGQNGIEFVREVLQTLHEVWWVFVQLFNQYVRPSLEEVWAIIQSELIPTLKELWEIVGPLLQPILEAFALIIVGVVIVALKLAVEILKFFVEWLVIWGQLIKNEVTKVRDLFAALPEMIGKALDKVYDAIVKPFTRAWDTVKDIAGKIRESLKEIDPFTRHSPSLVDNVIKGVDIIKREYQSLGDLTFPQVSTLFDPSSMLAGAGVTQDIDIHIDHVGGEQDVQMMGRELGFRASLSPRIFKA